MDPERIRLGRMRAGTERWGRWGPYLAERQWATVREDYSATGDAWASFPHDHARSRAYRWGEDGLLGISDSQARLCFALTLWNGHDPILKERLFGLTGPEGNHGEDVKEVYHYLDATPCHSYLKALYRYPQRAFPYADLVAVNGARGRDEPEYELVDTGVFDGDRYFDVLVEYAKATPDDILIRITAANRGPDPATLHLLPTLWFRNEWAWGPRGDRPAPFLRGVDPALIEATHDRLGTYRLACAGEPELLFTGNETNTQRLWSHASSAPYVKDGIDDAVVHGRTEAVDPGRTGTKASAHYVRVLESGATWGCLLRLSASGGRRRPGRDPFVDAGQVFATRIAEADEFYAPLADGLDDDARSIHRQACAGLIWTKQSYHYDVRQWLDGDLAGPAPPREREHGRNAGWRHLNNADVISMPDTWEYPWYASWDLAFHCVAFARIDPGFAKAQLVLLMREWYMHPNGQVPAYEWAFDDVNPPVLALGRMARVPDRRPRARRAGPRLPGACLPQADDELHLVGQPQGPRRPERVPGWLPRARQHRCLRSQPSAADRWLPGAGRRHRVDVHVQPPAAWPSPSSCARANHVYQDVATKYFEHFLYIAGAMNDIGGEGIALWDDEDGFFYDVLRQPDGGMTRLRVRSLVGLIPLLAVDTLEAGACWRSLPGSPAASTGS